MEMKYHKIYLTFQVDVPDIDNNIKISDEISVEMRYPSFEVFIDNFKENVQENLI